MPLLEAIENVGDNVVRFLLGESSRTSGMFGFTASSLVLAPLIVDCAALDIKHLADMPKWNARSVFVARNPVCVEALLAKRCCRGDNLIMLQTFDDLGAGRDSHILPECAGQAPHFNK
jgi:hypothetical protein